MEIRAIIRDCDRFGGKVLYFKSSGRFFKMTSRKDVELLSSQTFAALLQNWKQEQLEVVGVDEQIVYNGKPLFVSNELIKIGKRAQRKLGLIT